MSDWKQALAAAQARRKAAEEAISDDMQAEIAGREEAAREIAAAQEAERKARDLDIAHRLEALESAHPGARFEVVTFAAWPDSFIVGYNPIAHAKWDRAVDQDMKGEARGKNAGQRPDMAKVQRDYAMAVVEDWNGLTEFDAPMPFGPDHRPVATRGPIVSVAGSEAGASYLGAPGAKPSTGTQELLLFLTENPGIVTPILSAAIRLAGFIAEDRKS